MKRGDREKRIIVCKASAGSGKTKKLVDEVFKFIESHIKESERIRSPEEILEKFIAITFTNAAADEMKVRILKRLKEKALDNNEGDRKKYSLFVDALLLNYSDFHISTIDSLVNAIISCAPLESGSLLFPEYEIVSNPDPYIHRALDIIFKLYGEDKYVENIINEFIDGNIEVEDKYNWDLRSVFIKKIEEYRGMENTQDIIVGGYGDEDDKDYKRIDKELKEVLGYGLKSLMDKIKDGKTKKEKKEIEEIRNRLGSEKLEEAIRVYSIKKGSIGTKIYHIFKEHLKEVMEREGKVFLDELNKIASLLVKNFKEGKGVNNLLMKLGVSLEEVFIDEFQDTSLIQWKNICPIVDEVLSSGGRFFYVGDKKQAIYGFRGAKPELMDEVCSEFPQASSFEDVLTKNYRSARKIVEFNNKLFHPENIERWLRSAVFKNENVDAQELRNGIETIKSIYKEVKQECERDEEGYVFIKKIDYSEKDEYYEEVVRYLKMDAGLFERHSLSDIAFLVRKNKEVRAVAEALMNSGIMVESPQTLDVRKNPRIEEIIAFLNFIANPSDMISFSTFITGNIFEKISGISCAQMVKWIEGKRCSGVRDLFGAFRKDFQEFYERWFIPFSRKTDYLPLYEFIKEIHDAFNVYSNFPEDFWAFRHFEEVIHRLEEDGIMTLPAFLEVVERMDDKIDEMFMLSPSSANAVKVTTIHKAKGLEFPVVVLPEVELTKNDKVFKINNFLIKEEKDGSWKMAYCVKKFLDYNKMLKEYWFSEYIKALRDELNVLYVAFTRARDELYVFLPENEKKRGNIYIKLIMDKEEEDEKEIGSRGESCGSRFSMDEKESILKDTSLSGWEGAFIRGKPYVPASESELAKKREGEFIHDVLSRIKIIDGNVEEIVDRCLKESLKIWGNREFMERLPIFKSALVTVLKEPKIAQFFNGEFDAVYTEKVVCTNKGEVKRVDRVILRGDEVCVIDFKWGEKDYKTHSEQVKEYMGLVGAIYPDKRVRGFIVYLENGEVVEVSS